ncbi:MAG: hypothetical protein EKK32_05180 [Bradyrhizobiaceae bacterium]|nr:MAG: hypothetical protein EKK32_05180 [Bradyrhizobiaceae bacterium]
MLVSRAQPCMRMARAMVTNKPGAPGRPRISRQTIAQGRPECSAHLWFLPRAFLIARGPRVWWTPGLSCALDLAGGDRSARLGRSGAARTRCHILRSQPAFAFGSHAQRGTTAVASISTRAAFSTSRTTCTSAIAG